MAHPHVQTHIVIWRLPYVSICICSWHILYTKSLKGIGIMSMLYVKCSSRTSYSRLQRLHVMFNIHILPTSPKLKCKGYANYSKICSNNGKLYDFPFMLENKKAPCLLVCLNIHKQCGACLFISRSPGTTFQIDTRRPRSVVSTLPKTWRWIFWSKEGDEIGMKPLGFHVSK